MTSLFDIDVSVGHNIYSHDVVTKPLGRENFETHMVVPMPDNDTDKKKKKNGKYFCPGRMKGTVRLTENILHCTTLAIDIDEMSAKEWKMTEFMLEDGGYEYIRHTTMSHTPDTPRYRLILKPSRPLAEKEYRCVIKELAKALGITSFDKCSLAPAQGMFYPMVWDTFEEHARIEYSEGKVVDVEPYLTALVDIDSAMEEYENSEAALEPMAIPGALHEGMWYSCVLNAYPASGLVHFDEWLDVGLALWHQTDGRLYDTWLEWSRLNEARHCVGLITEDEMKFKRWPSFSPGQRERLITLRSILNIKTVSGRTVLALAYREVFNHIYEVSDLHRFTNDLQDEQYLHGTDYRYIASGLIKCTKRLTGEVLSVGEAMMLLKPEHKVGSRKEYFYNNYMFSEAESTYYNVNTKEPVSIISMNFMYGSRMPMTNSGEKKIVHKVLTNESNGFVKPRIMNGKIYEVLGSEIITKGPKSYLNEFEPASWPYVEKNFDVQDEIDVKVRKMVMSHLGLLCNKDDILIRMIVQHLGHLRQNPMQRLHFAYAISSSFHGAGKTTLRKLYETVLGEAQVNLLSASNIAEDFNAYAAMPKLMSFIEEFEFETRRAQNTAIKKMKDLITSDKVSLRKMRSDAHTAPAYTAYALFSNDEYVLGHESTGRRWVPIIVQAVNEEQCSETLGMPHEQFYKEYHDMMDSYPERFVAYFDQVSLENFKTERPPKTIQKQVFIENIPSMRCARIIQEIIEDKVSIDLTADYACGQSVFKLVQNFIEFNSSVDVDELSGFNNRQLRHLVDTSLKALGYHLAGISPERFRMPFDETERTRLNDIWVKNLTKYGGPMGICRLRKKVSILKASRQGRASRKVVNIKDDDSDAYMEL